MIVKSVQIRNCRSIESLTVTLSPKINVVVGKNNVGKSTFLRSICCLNRNLINVEEFINEGSTVTAIEFNLVGTTLSEKNILEASGGVADIVHGDYSRLRFETDPKGQSRGSLSQGQFWSDSCIIPIWSERKSVSINETVTLSATEVIRGTWEYLTALVDWSLGQGEVYRTNFINIVEQMSDVRPHTFASNQGKMAGTIIGKTNVNFQKMGGGIPHIYGFAATFLRAENKVILVEEPEIDLNPHALRLLCKLIKERSSVNQFIVSTHSNIVLRELAEESTKVFHFELKIEEGIPKTNVNQIKEPEAMKWVLEDLGYDASDLGHYKGFLILEESSAERLIRDFLIPWFVPRLLGRLRTVAANGVDGMSSKFEGLHNLFVLVHLQDMYKDKAWVVADGDEVGKNACSSLQQKFKNWSSDSFTTWEKSDFENYLPTDLQGQFFDGKGSKLKWHDRKGKWAGVFNLIISDPIKYRPILEQDCIEIIHKLREIEKSLNQ